MYPTVGKLPYKPCVHCSKKQLSVFSLFPGSVYIVQYPFNFCCRKIGVNQKARILLDILGKSIICFKLVTHVGCSSALPYDGVIHGDSGILVPYNGCFPLVRYAYGRDFRGLYFSLYHGVNCCAVLGVINILGIMLNPAGLWVNLRILLLAF